jgi:tRNA pseudouridine32 synthase / 23S rRNA pseudouridine746 synthase
VLYADDSMLVLDKPPGLLTVPGRGVDKQDCLASRAQAEYPDALVVHRLDMATSGLLLMARGAVHQRLLSQAFAAQQVHKRYAAVVAGQLQPDVTEQDGWCRIHLPIGADWAARPLRKIDLERGKPSTTLWRVIEHDAQHNRTRVELAPQTGRTHQLRVHLQALGHPIVGDALYAPLGLQNGWPPVQNASPRLLLHASELGFAHPATGQWHVFRSTPGF